jgi:hypothetical protein
MEHVDVAYAKRMNELEKEFREIVRFRTWELKIAKRLYKVFKKHVGKKAKSPEFKRALMKEFQKYSVSFHSIPGNPCYYELKIVYKKGKDRAFNQNIVVDDIIKADLSAPFGVPNLEYMGRKLNELKSLSFDEILQTHKRLRVLLRRMYFTACDPYIVDKIKSAL